VRLFAKVLIGPVQILAKQSRHAWIRLRRGLKRVLNARRWRWLAAHAKSLKRLPADLFTSLRVGSQMRACPACRSALIVLLEPLVISDHAVDLHVGFVTGCRECGLLFVNPPPDPVALAAFYSPDGTWGQYASERRPVLQRQAVRALAGIRKANPPRRRRDVLLEAIDHHVAVFTPRAGAAVLDFGCGDGKLLNVLLERGWRTFGIKPSSDVAFLRHTRLATIPSTPQFDFVIVNHVMEHLPSPLDLLQALAGAMKRGAAIYVSVPRLDGLPKHGDFRYCLNARTHPVSFTEECLRGLFARAALEPVVALNDAELDAQLTNGLPLRLRLIARKADAPLPCEGYPLRAATTALREYRRTTPTENGSMTGFPFACARPCSITGSGVGSDARRRDPRVG
jgi:2-polyprenyl-3-methyl-5-hydroxy-6-metoxy-1,4-benzoquinol methylase